jgi:flagellar basal-body rod protein FlgB
VIQGNGDRSEALLLRLLSASTERGRVIANNLANQNTPGYTRQVLRFEELVTSALNRRGADPLAVRPMVVEDTSSPRRHDGNNVNPELEANAGSENRLLYETYVAILQGRFQLLGTAIESR